MRLEHLLLLVLQASKELFECCFSFHAREAVTAREGVFRNNTELLFCYIWLQSGKVHFSYIYSIGVLGCLAVYALLNLMAVSGVSVGVTVSVLGYWYVCPTLLTFFPSLIYEFFTSLTFLIPCVYLSSSFFVKMQSPTHGGSIRNWHSHLTPVSHLLHHFV